MVVYIPHYKESYLHGDMGGLLTSSSSLLSSASYLARSSLPSTTRCNHTITIPGLWTCFSDWVCFGPGSHHSHCWTPSSHWAALADHWTPAGQYIHNSLFLKQYPHSYLGHNRILMLYTVTQSWPNLPSWPTSPSLNNLFTMGWHATNHPPRQQSYSLGWACSLARQRWWSPGCVGQPC